MTDDNIVEGIERFNMDLHIPSVLAPAVITGSVTSATGIIIDTTSKRYGYICHLSKCTIHANIQTLE